MAQVAHAALGIIPAHALALGVLVEGTNLHVVVRLSALDVDDLDDMDDIVGDLGALVGPHVTINLVHDISPRSGVWNVEGVQWVYLSRHEPTEEGTAEG